MSGKNLHKNKETQFKSSLAPSAKQKRDVDARLKLAEAKLYTLLAKRMMQPQLVLSRNETKKQSHSENALKLTETDRTKSDSTDNANLINPESEIDNSDM